MQRVPASVGQRLLWLMDHYRGSGNTLNEQVLMRITGRCDDGVVREAVQGLSARHGALRTGFAARGPRLTQVLHPESHPVHLRVADVSGSADPVAAMRTEIRGELTTHLDPAEPGLRPSLVHVAPDDHMLVLTMQHFVTDDWSNALIARDIGRLYAGVRGEPDELPGVGWQYAEWSQWQHERINGPDRSLLYGYWRDQLAGAQTPAIPRSPTVADAAEEPDWRWAKSVLDQAVTGRLQRLASSRRTTMFPVLLALFGALLHEMTDSCDVTVSSLFANRERPEVHETVGFFVSSLMLRCRLHPDRPFTELVDEARSTVMGAMRHQELPYQLLPSGTVATQGGRADEVTFQYLGALTTRADVTGSEQRDLQLEDQLAGRRFTVEFVIVPRKGGLTALVICDRTQFDQAWADRLVARYAELAGLLAQAPQTPVAQLARTR